MSTLNLGIGDPFFVTLKSGEGERKMNKKIEIVKRKYYGYTVPQPGETVEVQDVTVCLLLASNGDYARGMTVFNSDEDMYNITEGQRQAENSALRVLKKRPLDWIEKKELDGKVVKVSHTNVYRRQPAVNTLMRSGCPWIKKGELNPVLSFMERRILFGKSMENTNGKEIVFDRKNKYINALGEDHEKDAFNYWSKNWVKNVYPTTHNACKS